MDARTALITGGEGTLALAVGDCLRATGWNVLAPGKAVLDVTSTASVDAFFASAPAIRLLVNNAGIIDDALIASMTEEQWTQVVNVNLDGVFRCTRAALGGMIRAGGGGIINIGSFAALHGTAGQSAYAAAKAGLIGFTKAVALEHGRSNVWSNCVLPGFLETKMTAATLKRHREQIVAGHALGRLNTVAQSAQFIAQLAGFDHLSGQVFQLDSRVRRWG